MFCPHGQKKGVALISILFLGFLIGIRHAFEADHIAAMASLATSSSSLGQTVKQGAIWGLGHTIALLVFGVMILFTNRIVPENFAHWLEFAVGIMLIFLGADILRRMIRDRIHFHAHSHRAGVRHFHAHNHRSEREKGPHPEQHEHRHANQTTGGFPLRALLVGLMHGTAGSAALILLTLNTITMPLWGVIYIAIFGVGSILGMAAISLVLVVPLRNAKSLTWAHNGLQSIIGGTTIILGIYTLATAGTL